MYFAFYKNKRKSQNTFKRSARVGENRKKMKKKKKRRRKRVDKDDGKMGPVLENQWRRQCVGYFIFFSVYIFFLFV